MGLTPQNVRKNVLRKSGYDEQYKSQQRSLALSDEMESIRGIFRYHQLHQRLADDARAKESQDGTQRQTDGGI